MTEFAPSRADEPGSRAATKRTLLATALAPLASLKLTVVLFAMAIVIVLAGTLAQVDADVWHVVEQYFRIRPSQLHGSATDIVKAFFVWIDARIFFPHAFVTPWKPDFPTWVGFWFPKGWVIGGLMLLNLLSAHLIRFRFQAQGLRRVIGAWLLAIGGVVTWLVVASGSNNEGLQTAVGASHEYLWNLLECGLFGLSAGCVYLGLRTGREFRLERWMSFGAAGVLLLLGAAAVNWSDSVVSSSSAMRILYQLLKGLLAGLVLLAGCLVLFRRRAGIVLLHGGVALLMASEVLVGLNASESNMSLGEGETSSYVFDTRHAEFAIIDTSDPEVDQVTVIPWSALSRPGASVLHDSRLPFDIEVVQAFENAVVPPALPPEKDNPATAGIGLQRQARSVKSSVGVDSESGVDLPALYVHLTDRADGQDLKTWMTYVLEEPQTVVAGGKSYQVALRFARTYLPYSIALIDVRKDDYVGTDTPRNYSSQVVLADPDLKTRQKLTIWMNNPLRYRGLTFYQSGYHRDPRTGQESTTLQVVSNAGWMIPYVSCMIVGVGMAYQFVLTLLRFLNRVSRSPVAAPNFGAAGKPAAARDLPTGSARSQRRLARRTQTSPNWNFWVPLGICLVAGGYALSKARTPQPPATAMDLPAFGRLPLAAAGRVKPFDSLARYSLVIISGKQEFRDQDGGKHAAIEWLLDVISDSPRARQDRVFRITNLDLLKLLKIEPRFGYTYAASEFAPELKAFDREVNAIASVPPASLDVYQRSLRNLASNLTLYQQLVQAFVPELPELPSADDQKANPERADNMLRTAIQSAIQRSRDIEGLPIPLAVPVSNSESPADETSEKWQPFSTALVRAYLQSALLGGAPPQQTLDLERIFSAYRREDVDAFNNAVKDYGKWLRRESLAGVNLAKVGYEQFFNQFSPFYWCMVLCLGAFILSAVSWLGFHEPLRRSAFWLMVLTFAVHTFALGSRIYISGRPPVTNLYSTGIFIGWAVVAFGLVCELIYPFGVCNAVASLAGFITLGISHFLSEGGTGDTITVMQAVLDTTFWLATHVVTINLGYAATAAAGLFGVYAILYRCFSPSPQADIEKAVARMTYGSLCFAMLFSFVGTVLGGLWADDSWGRFWGWDPKENGALMIVLWNALVLHARWDGMIKDRGLAVLTTLGLVAVSWSWFGTNHLGAGLHAYGNSDPDFANTIRFSLFGVWILSLMLAGLGCLPRRRSSPAEPPATA